MRRKASVINEYRAQLQRQASEEAASEERQRLARDLHDSIKQQIFGIRMSALAAQAQLTEDAAKAQEALADIQQSATEVQVEMQALLQQLRLTPLEHTSFAEAIYIQAEALEHRSEAEVRIEMADLPASDRCPLSMQEAIFRIVQEAFANIARHARARHVVCSIVHDETMLRVVISDDGQGFDPQKGRKGMGLTNIQERARYLDGRATVTSTPGHGTTINIQIPLLPPTEMKQQQEQREQKARELATRARAALQLRSIMAVFTLLLTIIDLALFTANASANRKELAFLILGFCLFMLLYSLTSAGFALARLKTYRGANDREASFLRLRASQGLTATFRLALFSSWHLVLWAWRLSLTTADWKIESGFLIVIVLILVFVLLTQRWIKDAQDSYYRLLSGQELKRAVAQHRKSIQIRVILAFCVVLSLFINGAMPFSIPVLLWQWLADSFFFALFILCLCIVIDAWQLQPWRKLARAAAQEQGM